MKAVNVYAEMTPNPSTIKFVTDVMLTENGEIAEFFSLKQAKGYSKFAEKLFEFPFVSGVFISNNFISVTKIDAVSWDDIVLETRVFIRQWLLENDTVLEKSPELVDSNFEDFSTNKELKSKTVFNPENFSDKEQQISDILEEYVVPAVNKDGGLIFLNSFNEKTGIVTVVLKGACSGCPSSTQTLKFGIEGLLKNHLPEITSVVALEE